MSQPKELNLPYAYRTNPYSVNIEITSDTKPKVIGKIYNGKGLRELVPALQPGELPVTQKEGTDNTWVAEFKIADLKMFPQISFVEILADGIVVRAGDLKVGYETAK